jgi:peptidoglycan/LPS O-acetylase OafA/YrhL
MGTLRTLLAITVVLAHVTGGDAFVGAKNAVQMFYVMSGFLMSYVLTESRTYATTRDFYINRYLRLYPIYFVVGVLAIGAQLAAQQAQLRDVYRDAPASASLFLTGANLTLFAQDWVHFMSVEGGKLALSSNFYDSEVPLYRGLIVPQAWTIGVELSFYLVAPFVLRSRKLLVSVLLLSLGVRVFLMALGLGRHDPWSYRFFPAELMLFLLGSLAHQVLLPRYRTIFQDALPGIAVAVTALTIAMTLAYAWIPGSDLLKEPVLFLAFTLAVPMAFVFQGKSALDRWVGELSYPIYINHMLVIMLLAAVDRRIGMNPLLVSASTVVMSIVAAILLNRFVGEPFERVRRRFRAASVPGSVKP